MAKFNFEKNLPHQSQAINNTISVFDGLEIKKSEGINHQYINPSINKDTNYKYSQNIGNIQEQSGIERNVNGQSNIIDIMMETGTGKTYTYTKTIFEINKLYGIFKFIVVIPTLSIKAGTINFLTSESAREHFKEQYDKTIKLHVVESKKGGKNKKSYMPQAVNSFVNAGSFEKKSIQVMIMNAGMINSKTMQKEFDKNLLDNYSNPFEAISCTNPFLIIDEPHKFAQENKTWENIKKMNPQFIIRYGATFKEYENLIYNLTAVDSFSRNLVKGVVGHITEFEKGNDIFIRFLNSDTKEANFELKTGKEKKNFKIIKKESFEKIHHAMTNLYIENLNKSTVVLSNGLELKKGDKINPYSYSQTVQETMIKKAIEYHFKIEKDYLTRDVKIKPLTLFFIDNIDEYRSKDGYTKKTVEKYIKAEVKELLKKETDDFYKIYLEKTLKDISKTHGGYFSKDNSSKDDLIEKEVIEILHDKQALLDLSNIRRFIFSKWTLREGWDNPNVFQICKLRSSGSEISKLQEVGRGLRLPVNQYGNRVKDEEFYLNYFVDFTESDFIDNLRNEINDKSGAISREDIPDKLTDKIIKQIVVKYNINEADLLEKLDNNNVIKRNNDFKENGFEYIKINYPLIFEGVDSNKIRKTTDTKKKVNIRVEKYLELKELWEKLNEKVILEYKIKNENEFKNIFIDFLKENNDFSIDGLKEKIQTIEIEYKQAVVREESTIYGDKTTFISTMKYNEFLKQLSKELNINLKTIHHGFIESKIEIKKHMSQTTIRNIKSKFNKYLMYKAINKFEIAYQKISNEIHPTKFTNKKGEVFKEINASDIGTSSFNKKVADSYFFDQLFYDSDLEKENIEKDIKEIIVFTKIPKNSIKYQSLEDTVILQILLMF